MLLGAKYPGGSAKSDLEIRKNKLKETGVMIFDDTPENLLDEIIEEVLEYGEDRGLI